jgi:hypothetical protein
MLLRHIISRIVAVTLTHFTSAILGISASVLGALSCHKASLVAEELEELELVEVGSVSTAH